MENLRYDPKHVEEILINVEINGENKECFIVAIPKSKHGNYIALLPKEKEYFKSGKLLLFKFIENNNMEPRIESIEDDAEYDFANYLLTEIIDDHNYYELLEKYKDEFND